MIKPPGNFVAVPLVKGGKVGFALSRMKNSTAELRLDFYERVSLLGGEEGKG